jgi:lipopolysaccharide biosynthesis protein
MHSTTTPRAVRLIAQYFPQLHAIPENDRWWGAGFTDWVNVKRARPLYSGHYQPRVPAGRDYYDQSQLSVVRRQVELAKAHGISAFCHYHYWFDGRSLLSRPTDLFLANKDIDFQFCLAWANETWSRRWDGQDHQILIEQTHPPTKASWGRHFDRLIGAWTDERALRVDGKPVFLIYRPYKIAQLPSMLDYWQERARAHGLDGIHFVCMVQSYFPPWEHLKHFDAAMLFQPFEAAQAIADAAPPTHVPLWRTLGGKVLDRLPFAVRDPIQNITQASTRPRRLDYDATWERILARPTDKHVPVYPGAFVDWDNTARYRRRATIFRGAAPEKLEGYLRRLVDKVAREAIGEPLVFINAWNEWAESAYLEPDERYGLAYLEAVRRALEPDEVIPARVAR